MKKAILIGGGILLVGGLAYLYFTNKKKTEKLLSSGTTPSTSGGATTSTTTSGNTSTINAEIPPLSTGGIVTATTKANTAEEQAKLDKANGIYSQISKLYVSINKTLMSSSIPSFSKKNQIGSYEAKIKSLKKNLATLGYEYRGSVDGVLVKL